MDAKNEPQIDQPSREAMAGKLQIYADKFRGAVSRLRGRSGEMARSRREVNLAGRFNAADDHTRSTKSSHRTLTGRIFSLTHSRQ
jgi:hypothetical protein